VVVEGEGKIQDDAMVAAWGLGRDSGVNYGQCGFGALSADKMDKQNIRCNISKSVISIP
jgi:hypothetical protein